MEFFLFCVTLEQFSLAQFQTEQDFFFYVSVSSKYWNTHLQPASGCWWEEKWHITFFWLHICCTWVRYILSTQINYAKNVTYTRKKVGTFSSFITFFNFYFNVGLLWKANNFCFFWHIYSICSWDLHLQGLL